jgi:hypothetical protein
MLNREETIMNRTPQIQPGCIRVQAQIGEMSGACDYIVEKLPQWLSTMERVCVPPLVRGAEDSAQMAGYMTYGAAAQGQWDLACISALWIVLYGPTVRDTTLADFMKLADNGVITITASADGSRWHMKTPVLEPVIH